MARKRQLKARARRNVIRGLVKAGVKMNFDRASSFTQNVAEERRLNRIAQLGRRFARLSAGIGRERDLPKRLKG